MTKNIKLLNWVDQMAALCKPDKVVWIDGSEEQLEALRKEPGENQMSYVNIFLTAAVKTHGKLVCTSDELIKTLNTMYGRNEA